MRHRIIAIVIIAAAVAGFYLWGRSISTDKAAMSRPTLPPVKVRRRELIEATSKATDTGSSDFSGAENIK